MTSCVGGLEVWRLLAGLCLCLCIAGPAVSSSVDVALDVGQRWVSTPEQTPAPSRDDQSGVSTPEKTPAPFRDHQRGVPTSKQTPASSRDDQSGVFTPEQTPAPFRDDHSGVSTPEQTAAPSRDDQSGVSTPEQTAAPSRYGRRGVPTSEQTPTVSRVSSDQLKSPEEDDGSAELVNWLTRYGYLPPPDPSTGQLQAWTAVTHAVRAMQRFGGLEETGLVDEETQALMRAPRCSLPDQQGEEEEEGSGQTANQLHERRMSLRRTGQSEETSGQKANRQQEGRRSLRRRKRVAATWKRRSINWRLRSSPATSQLSHEMIRSLVFYALRVWAEPTPLEFHEVSGQASSDLQVDFLHGYHGDGYPFDGVGGAIGHAFFPSDPNRAGGIHLDAEEDWAFRQTEGTDLFTVLLHEFGHALGLSHSSSRSSLMRPYYQGPAGDPLSFRLGPLDLEHIIQLYGKRSQLRATDPPRLITETHLHHRHTHRHRSHIDRCETSFDAVAQIRGEMFFFKGQTMWRVGRGGGLVSGQGSKVRRLWGGLPPDLPPLRAVVERQSDHAIIFISGSQFWLFRDLSLQEGYPRPLTELHMAPGSTPGPVAGPAREQTAGQRGLVWDPVEGPIWGETAGLGQKGAGDTWTRLLRGGVTGITTETNGGSVYLFKGDSYWKFLFPGSASEAGYPRSLAQDWLDCPDQSSSSSSSLELRERSRGEEEEERRDEAKGADGRQQGQHRHTDSGHRDRQRDRGLACTCRNVAPEVARDLFMVVVLLSSTLWTLIFLTVN